MVLRKLNPRKLGNNSKKIKELKGAAKNEKKTVLKKQQNKGRQERRK